MHATKRINFGIQSLRRFYLFLQLSSQKNIRFFSLNNVLFNQVVSCMIIVYGIIVGFFIIKEINILVIILGDSSFGAIVHCIVADLAELGNFAI